VPPFGSVVHKRIPGTLLVGILGDPIASPPLLRDRRFLARVDHASRGLDALLSHPSVPGFFELSEQFTDRMALAPAPLVRLLRSLRRQGAWAAQAMFGRSFFVRPRTAAARRDVLRWLQRAGVAAVELSPDRLGARRLVRA
jgi:pantoate kinase